MQTFLADESHFVTAALLDTVRLGKQRVECMQIINALCDLHFDNNLWRVVERPARGWQNHTASRMWRGHERALARYGMIISAEYGKRTKKDGTRNKDTCEEKLLAYDQYLARLGFDESEPAWWINEPMKLAVIRSHRSNLIRKDPAFYGPLWPDLDGSIPYLWPVP